jgi:recombination protein RecA
MPLRSSSLLKVQIERALEHSFPAALTAVPRCMPEVAAIGIEDLDALLNGGLPVGAISELTGPDSSGRTSLAFTFVAQRIASGNVCAWIDASDSLDPESAAACGVDLKRLLWVRCSYAQQRPRTKPLWVRLEQAMRAADLLLQVGGFAAIVLDLGNIAPEQGCRIPLATWFRWRQASDRTRCCLVVLGRMAYAQSSAAVVVECAPFDSVSCGQNVLQRFELNAACIRERSTAFSAGMRKPAVAEWSLPVAWDAERRA